MNALGKYKEKRFGKKKDKKMKMGTFKTTYAKGKWFNKDGSRMYKGEVDSDS